jgi:putative sterol carrier protein
MTEQRMTPQEFKEMVKGRSDEELLGGAKGNEDALLDGIFAGMEAAFDPSKAAGQTAEIQYEIDTPAGVRKYRIGVDKGTCTIERGSANKPRVTVGVNLPNFIRLITGELDGTQAFMARKLRIAGDIMFSQNLNNWFKRI